MKFIKNIYEWFIIEWYSDILIKGYVEAMKKDFDVALMYVIKNRKLLKIVHGNNIAAELILNYRTRQVKYSNVIMDKFNKIVLSKNTFYKSDLMIAWNIVIIMDISKEDKEMLLNFLKVQLAKVNIICNTEEEIMEKTKEYAGHPWDFVSVV